MRLATSVEFTSDTSYSVTVITTRSVVMASFISTSTVTTSDTATSIMSNATTLITFAKTTSGVLSFICSC